MTINYCFPRLSSKKKLNMEQVRHTTPGIKQYILIAFLTILSCFLLFSVDKDTHSFNDLLKLGNLAALVVYFIPTFLVSIILLKYFSKKNQMAKSITLSLLIGVPVCFTIIIISFLNFR